MANTPFISITSKENKDGDEQGNSNASSAPVTKIEVDRQDIQVDDRIREAIENLNDGEGTDKSKEFSLSIPGYKVATKGPVKVKYTVMNKNYIYQVAFAGEPSLSIPDILTLVITACSAIIPEHIEVFIYPPSEEIPMYTIKAENVTDLPGAKIFMEERLVEKFLNLSVW